MWGFLPAALKAALRGYVHPVALGERSPGTVLDVPSAEPVRSVDIVLASARPESPVTGPRTGSTHVLSRDEDPFRLAAERSIADAIVFVGRDDSRRPHYRTLGWRLAEDGDEMTGRFPSVSIVVTSYRNPDLVRSCLRSIERNTPWPGLEVIVVDNASGPETVALLSELAARLGYVKIVQNPDNLGFAHACNQGIRAATGTYVVLLNDDTVVAPGWLSRLVAHLELHPTLGIVGPSTNHIGNEAKVSVEYATLEQMERQALQRSFAHAGVLHQTDCLALFCAAARRDLLVEIGALDERFEIGMFEDDDLAVRIRERGLSLGIARDAFVHHVGHASFGKMSDAEYLTVWQANRRRFEDKWKRRWVPPVVERSR
jgi:GT2 family glycosyltransferase